MGWANWVLFRFVNKTVDDTLKLKFPNTDDHWGYPFAGTKDTNTRNRIEYSDIQQVDIKPKGSYSYGQTGKPNTFAGMEGTVDIPRQPREARKKRSRGSSIPAQDIVPKTSLLSQIPLRAGRLRNGVLIYGGMPSGQ